MSRVAQFPIPQSCHACDNKFAGSVCPLCKTERPTYTAMKRITARAHHGVQPLRNPNACRYFTNAICGCGGRGTCLDVA
jgi:hypothetical protein